jgi:hypothetical protein
MSSLSEPYGYGAPATATTPVPTKTAIPVKAKARTVARIFNAVAWAVLVVGGLLVVGFIAVALETSDYDYLGGYSGAAFSLLAVFAALYTVLLWASITLATIVASYIANRSEH